MSIVLFLGNEYEVEDIDIHYDINTYTQQNYILDDDGKTITEEEGYDDYLSANPESHIFRIVPTVLIVEPKDNDHGVDVLEYDVDMVIEYDVTDSVVHHPPSLATMKRHSSWPEANRGGYIDDNDDYIEM